jgi:hypothetical protein
MCVCEYVSFCVYVCVCVCVCLSVCLSRYTLVAIEGDVDLVPALVLDVAGWGGERVDACQRLDVVVPELVCVCVCVCV